MESPREVLDVLVGSGEADGPGLATVCDPAETDPVDRHRADVLAVQVGDDETGLPEVGGEAGTSPASHVHDEFLVGPKVVVINPVKELASEVEDQLGKVAGADD